MTEKKKRQLQIHQNISVSAAMMSSALSLRDFISQRLTAAAEEIFTEFEKTIVHYEEEIDRQRRLLDITWTPRINTNTTDQDVCKEEEVLWNQHRNSSLDQEEPEPPHIKEEQQEPEQQEVVLKQEADTFTGQEREPITEQLYSQNPPFTERTNQGSSKNLDSGSSTDVEMSPDKRRSRTRTNVDMSQSQSGRKSVACDICRKAFRDKHDMQRHYRTHTGERPYTCQTCGRRFTQNGTLLVHMKTHTGDKPFSCLTCGKNFPMRWVLLAHMRVHTGERPFSCGRCGRDFSHKSSLRYHVSICGSEPPQS